MYIKNVNAVYGALRAYQREHRYSPTIRNLSDMTGLCKQTVLSALNLLVAQGAVVTRARHAPRRFYISTEPSQYQTP